jgi:hypothetical protein
MAASSAIKTLTMIINILMPIRDFGAPCNPCNFNGMFQNNQNEVQFEVVASVTADTLNEVWAQWQHLTEDEDFQTRSLSVGDLLHQVGTDNYYMVKGRGFELVNYKPKELTSN